MSDIRSSRHKTVRISAGLVEAVKEFMDSEVGKRMGLNSRADVVEHSLREFLDKYGFYARYEKITQTV